jgi:hypothetical protein
MSHFSPLKNDTRSFENALQWLTAHGFHLAQPTPGGSLNELSKNQCVAAVERASDGSARLVGFPACIVAGEPAMLVDRGYQKFFKSSKMEIAATSERLQDLHSFSEELKEALGYTSLYNDGRGSVSGSYQYDRVVSRDLPEAERPVRPWQR